MFIGISMIRHRLSYELRAWFRFLTNKKLRKLISDYTYMGDGILTTHYLPFKDSKVQSSFDDAFSKVPKKFTTLRKIEWRFSILVWAYRQTIPLGGVVIECGVWYGVLSRALINHYSATDPRKFLLFDSWGESGFSMQGPYKKNNYLQDIYDVVRQRFQNTPAHLIRGSLPGSLQIDDTDCISLLMIDLNSGWLEYEVLALAWDKIPQGGIIYLDDYGQDFPIVREAMDKFVKERDQNLLVFPTGQAIIIKG
jgi:hypothetical protein